VALAPQPVSRPQSFGPPGGGPAPLSGFWLGIAAAVLGVASVIAGICKAIAARWRGIVIAHLFFLTLWLAIQVFFFATGAYWCLPANSSRFAQWLTRSFGAVARCGPAAPASVAFHGSAAAAAPAPASPTPAPPPPPAVVPAPPPRAASPVPSYGISPPPAAAAPAAPAFGSASRWSARTIGNCWRNRAIGNGGCYETADPRRSRPPPPRYRYPERPPPPPRGPCRRAYDCWPDDYWRDDL
jgi:hypothetical protein